MASHQFVAGEQPRFDDQHSLTSNVFFHVLSKVSTVVSIVVSSVHSNRSCGLVRVQFPPRNRWQVVALGTSSDIDGVLFSRPVAGDFACTHFYQ